MALTQGLGPPIRPRAGGGRLACRYLVLKAGKRELTPIEGWSCFPGPQVPTGHHVSWNVLPKGTAWTRTASIPCKASINSSRLHLCVARFHSLGNLESTT